MRVLILKDGRKPNDSLICELEDVWERYIKVKT